MRCESLRSVNDRCSYNYLLGNTPQHCFPNLIGQKVLINICEETFIIIFLHRRSFVTVKGKAVPQHFPPQERLLLFFL